MGAVNDNLPIGYAGDFFPPGYRVKPSEVDMTDLLRRAVENAEWWRRVATWLSLLLVVAIALLFVGCASPTLDFKSESAAAPVSLKVGSPFSKNPNPPPALIHHSTKKVCKPDGTVECGEDGGACVTPK